VEINLTKQQIFNLQIKWSYIYPINFNNSAVKNWWEHQFNWNLISLKKDLPEGFLREFKEHLNWDIIKTNYSLLYTLSVEFKKELMQEGYI